MLLALTRVYGREDKAEVQRIELAEDFDDYQGSLQLSLLQVVVWCN